MADDKTEIELLGDLIKTHAEYTQAGMKEIKDLIYANDKTQREHIGKLYEKDRENEKKTQKAHVRIDKHEIRFNTIKGMIVAVAALIAWLFGFKD